MTSPTAARLWTAPYATTVGATALVFVSIGMTIPVLPFYAIDRFGVGKIAVGLIFAVTAVSGLVLRPLLGKWGDTHGRRKLLLGGAVVTALGLAGHAVATTVALLVLARLILGLGQAAVMIAATTLAMDLAPARRRGEAASFVFVAVQIGWGVGPLLGQAAADLSLDTAWLSAAAGALVSAGLALSLPTVPRRQRADGETVVLVRADHGAAAKPGVIAGIGSLAFSGFLAFIPLYAVHIGIGHTALVFLLASGTIVAVRTFGAGIPDRFGPKRIATVALCALGLGFGVMAVGPDRWALYAGTVIMACGLALLTPALVLLATHGLAPGEETRRMSTFTLFQDLGGAIGPGILGVVVSMSGYGPGLATCTILAALGIGLVFRWVPGRTAGFAPGELRAPEVSPAVNPAV